MSNPRGRPSTEGSWFFEVLIAQGRLSSPTRRDGSIRESVAIGISAALHAAAIGILVWRPGPTLPPPMHPLEIEMILEQGRLGGPTPSRTAPAPETPPAPQGSADLGPARPRPPPQARQATAPQPPAPEVNLGNTTPDQNRVVAFGDNVVPPRPDARYRNLPPNYPAAAVRVGAEGTVVLVIRVAPNGLPLQADIVDSSGNVSLDEEARRAVMLWRFQPARDGGRAVPYDYPISIHFAVDSP